MNERFSAQLRQHLLDTANERPADGQLAAVVEGVAATGQRPSMVARLTWFPGRIGPFPSAGLRYGLVTLALALVTVVAAILVGGSVRPPSTVFEGAWTSTDPGDGSRQTLTVGAGSTPAVHFEDDFASGPGCRADAIKRFTAEGTGSISGNRLDTRFAGGGGCGLMLVAVPGWSYDYNPGTDTLLDSTGLMWARVPSGAGHVTQAPATKPSATEPSTPDASVASAMPAFPTAVPECIQFTQGGTYRASVGTLSLSVTVPAGPVDTYWHGLRDSFYLLRAPCLFGGPALKASLVTRVYADACNSAGTGVEVNTAAAAAAALAAQAGHEVIGPTDVTLDGRPASRLEIPVPADFDASSCDGGVVLWLAPFGRFTNVDPGSTVTVYLVDVDGLVLAVTTTHWTADEAEIPTLQAELDSIVASLRIEP